MAAGYATARPPVHPRVIELALRALGQESPFARALDLGCGAGLSTRALCGAATMRAGLEPAVAMLGWAAGVDPEAYFVAGAAEMLPFAGSSFDLITAAGSLNYADLDRFFPEARRVLQPRGVMLVYDFTPGRKFRGRTGLEAWFDAFRRRYPPPANEAGALDPAILAGLDSGLEMGPHAQFEIALELDPEFYLAYVLTETNVAAAVRLGTSLEDIRAWCASTLAPVWNGKRHEVVFEGYYACMSRG
jgi:SAM-dependent methyltransferase